MKIVKLLDEKDMPIEQLRIHSKLTVNFKPANNVTPSFVWADILDIDHSELFIRNFKARYIFIPVCLTENLESCFCVC